MALDSCIVAAKINENYVCQINMFCGFFCFFAGIVGYYGKKYHNKEYMKTVSHSKINFTSFQGPS